MGELTEGEDPEVLPMLTREDEQRGAVRQLKVRHNVRRTLPHNVRYRPSPQRATSANDCSILADVGARGVMPGCATGENSSSPSSVRLFCHHGQF